mgnify:CR=1 FL=1|uniref:GSQS6193 n=1 Tax=Homo sapiens TaxID=9606 RepID=Q6UXW7_HUMAN|nr:GSQS6193 [Homo sapiens]
MGSQSWATRQQDLVGLVLGSAGFGVAVAALGDIGLGAGELGTGRLDRTQAPPSLKAWPLGSGPPSSWWSICPPQRGKTARSLERKRILESRRERAWPRKGSWSEKGHS